MIEAGRVMTNCDPEGRIFLSFPHTKNGFFFWLTTFFILSDKLPDNLEYAKMQFYMMASHNIAMTSLNDHVREFQYIQLNVCSPHVTAWVR